MKQQCFCIRPEEEAALEAVRQAYKDGKIEEVSPQTLAIALGVIRHLEAFQEKNIGTREMMEKIKEVLRQESLTRPVDFFK